MHLSIFLSQVIGCYLVITSLAVLIYQGRFRKILQEFLSSAPLIALSGTICLVFGLLLVASHNLWIARWPVVITIIGWIFIARSILQLFFPDFFAKMTKKVLERRGFLLLYWVILLVGIYLLWAGLVD